MFVLLYQHTRDDSDSMVIVLILSFIHHAGITLEVITLNEGPNRVQTFLLGLLLNCRNYTTPGKTTAEYSLLDNQHCQRSQGVQPMNTYLTVQATIILGKLHYLRGRGRQIAIIAITPANHLIFAPFFRTYYRKKALIPDKC